MNKPENKFIKKAIKLSVENVKKGKGGPFGAVIVKDNNVIAKATNIVTSTNDPTAHAEIIAIRKASKKLKNFNLKGCEIYASCEPCPMCLAAIYWAGIKKIHYAASKEDAEDNGFNDKFIYNEFAKPLSEKKIQMHQLFRDKALMAFKEWQSKEGKIMY
ncbi:MAG: nucleoside deaminase [Bacteroidales bacterium]|nr:nucleoside deaminase [Bacteroidales bacterium]